MGYIYHMTWVVALLHFRIPYYRRDNRALFTFFVERDIPLRVGIAYPPRRNIYTYIYSIN